MLFDCFFILYYTDEVPNSFSILYILFPIRKKIRKIKISVIWFSCLILICVLLIAVQLVQKKIQNELEKWNQFECGFNVITPTHVPFSFQFFLIALLFLIFDVEIALVLSFPIEPTTIKNISTIFLFILILALGLIYEWQKGKINWSKWMGRISLQENLVNNPNP